MFLTLKIFDHQGYFRRSIPGDPARLSRNSFVVGGLLKGRTPSQGSLRLQPCRLRSAGLVCEQFLLPQ
jgi:hypothetical protein